MIFIFVILPFILSKTTSVTRFGEILAKNNYLAIFWRLFLYLANFWTHFVTFLCYSSANFHFSKWPNIEQIISPSVLLISQSILYSSFSHCLASVFLLAPSWLPSSRFLFTFSFFLSFFLSRLQRVFWSLPFIIRKVLQPQLRIKPSGTVMKQSLELFAVLNHHSHSSVWSFRFIVLTIIGLDSWTHLQWQCDQIWRNFANLAQF